MACAGFMRPLNMPRYYLKQKAALARNNEDQLFEKPQLDDLKIATGSIETTPEKSLMVKELLITIDSKDLAIQTEKKKGNFLAGFAIVKVIKKKQQAYSRYMHSIYEILQDQAMVAFCIAVFLFCLGAFPPVLFIEDVAQSEGLIEEVSVIPLVSIGAIATCVGKLALGVLVDIRWINGIYLYGFTMFAGGLALFLIPVTKSYLGLQILSAVLGFFSGNWSLTSYITTRIVGLDRLTQAHGILMFFGGFGIMLGPPVVGKRTVLSRSHCKVMLSETFQKSKCQASEARQKACHPQLAASLSLFSWLLHLAGILADSVFFSSLSRVVLRLDAVLWFGLLL